MIEREAFRVTIAFPGERYSLLEFDKRCSRVRSVVRGILTPMALGSRLREQLDFREDRSWLVYSVRCSGQLPLALELKRDFSPRSDLDDEVESARGLWHQYFAVLADLLSRACVSGMQLEEMRDQLPQMNAVYRAFKGRDDSAKTVYRLEDALEVPFQLSPLPHRFLGQELVDFECHVKTTGPAQAQGRLTAYSRARLGASRRDIELLWEPKPGDRSISTRLFDAAHKGVEVTAVGRRVFNSKGKVAGIVLESLKSQLRYVDAEEIAFTESAACVECGDDDVAGSVRFVDASMVPAVWGGAARDIND